MMTRCNGICIMGYELIEGASGVAYAHPQCEEHGYPCENGTCEDHHARTAPMADGSESQFCCACSWMVHDYVWPCREGAS